MARAYDRILNQDVYSGDELAYGMADVLGVWDQGDRFVGYVLLADNDPRVQGSSSRRGRNELTVWRPKLAGETSAQSQAARQAWHVM